MYGSVRGTARKGGSYRDNLLCEAPFGPFRTCHSEGALATEESS